MYCITLCNSSPKACSRISRNCYSVFFSFPHSTCFPFPLCPSGLVSGDIHFWSRFCIHLWVQSIFTFRRCQLAWTTCHNSALALLLSIPSAAFLCCMNFFLPNVWTVSVLYPACSYSLFFLPFSVLSTKLFFSFLFHGSVTPQFRFIF